MFDKEQAVKKYDMAAFNADFFNIFDQFPLGAPNHRERSSENFITIIPNTKENITLVKEKLRPCTLVFYGRGPRNHGRNNYESSFYHTDSGSYDLKKNPPYLAVYFKNKN